MKIKVIVHEAEEGGYWAEVPAIPGCATEADTLDELKRNLREAYRGLAHRRSPHQDRAARSIIPKTNRASSLSLTAA